MTENKTLTNATHATLLVLAILALLVVGQKFLVPVTWAFLFSFVLYPICVRLERRKVKRTTASLLAVLMFCVVSGLVLAFLVYEAVMIVKHEPELYVKLKENIVSLMARIEDVTGLSLDRSADANAGEGPAAKVLPWVAREVSAIGENLVTVLLVPIYLFFMLTFRGNVTRFMQRRFQAHHVEFLGDLLTSSRVAVQSYLSGTLLLTAIIAVVTFVVLVVFGVRHAFFFAVFYAILSLIPYIGHTIAFIMIVAFTWVTKDSGVTVLLVAVALYVINLSQENFLRPKLIGSKMEMNSMVVFTAVVIGGMVWGLSGMVLFIPLLGVAKVVIVRHDPIKPYAALFEP